MPYLAAAPSVLKLREVIPTTPPLGSAAFSAEEYDVEEWERVKRRAS